MPASVASVLKIQVGARPHPTKEGELQKEYREIGVILDMSTKDGSNHWQEMRLHLEVFNPVLFSMLKTFADKGSASIKCQMFDPPKRAPASKTPLGPQPQDDEPSSEDADWTDRPF